MPYADLSDFFLVWLKRTLPGHPLLRDPSTLTLHGGSGEVGSMVTGCLGEIGRNEGSTGSDIDIPTMGGILPNIMYFRVSTRRYKDRTYNSFQLVECHRHPETRKPTTRVLASLGDLSKLDEGDRMALVVSLARALGVLDLVKLDSEELRLADLGAATARARSVGAMWAILEVMRQLHIPEVWEELVADRKNHGPDGGGCCLWCLAISAI